MTLDNWPSYNRSAKANSAQNAVIIEDEQRLRGKFNSTLVSFDVLWLHFRGFCIYL